MKVERSYASPESYQVGGWNSGTGGTHVEDDRNGQRHDIYLNPTSPVQQWAGRRAGDRCDFDTKHGTGSLRRAGRRTRTRSGCWSVHEGLTGGSNLFPQTIENVPYFKTNYDAMSVFGDVQHDGAACSAYAGDQLLWGGGLPDRFAVSDVLRADFGTRRMKGRIRLTSMLRKTRRCFRGRAASGCTMGSTVVTVAASAGAGNSG